MLFHHSIEILGVPKMKLTFIAVASVVALAAGVTAQTRPAAAKPLEIYVVDVEGGKADLWVTPSGQTVFTDTGSPGARDVDRIMEVINAAGVKQIDYLLTTHYHVDHVGGLQELVKRIPVMHFLDHGPTIEDGAEGHQREQVAGFQAAYAEIFGKVKHTVLKPGDKIPVTGLDWRVVAAAAKVTKTPLPGGGKPNPECATAQRPTIPRDPENSYSVGSIVGFGAFRLLDFGDMTADIEYDLMCPNNPIGTVDMYFASNHGTNNANSPVLVHAVAPRVAVVQNAAGKGASVEMFQALRTSVRLEDVWELHWGNVAGAEWNSAGVFIANGVEPAAIAAALTAPPRAGGAGGRGGAGGPAGAPGQAPQVPPPASAPAGAVAPQTPAAPPQPGAAALAAAGQPGPGGAGGRGGGLPPHSPAYWIKISVQPNGSFTVTNTRNNFSKTYPAN
jgi:beta-lactamase superfamily II metal-dependent hydrolase